MEGGLSINRTKESDKETMMVHSTIVDADRSEMGDMVIERVTEIDSIDSETKVATGNIKANTKNGHVHIDSMLIHR